MTPLRSHSPTPIHHRIPPLLSRPLVSDSMRVSSSSSTSSYVSVSCWNRRHIIYTQEQQMRPGLNERKEKMHRKRWKIKDIYRIYYTDMGANLLNILQVHQTETTLPDAAASLAGDLKLNLLFSPPAWLLLKFFYLFHVLWFLNCHKTW